MNGEYTKEHNWLKEMSIAKRHLFGSKEEADSYGNFVKQGTLNIFPPHTRCLCQSSWVTTRTLTNINIIKKISIESKYFNRINLEKINKNESKPKDSDLESDTTESGLIERSDHGFIITKLITNQVNQVNQINAKSY